ncbi:hypothetical protein Gotur_027887 [Gossypium turneri]
MVISVYVPNLPSCFHWKGPWKISEFHSKVLDSFIPNKRHRKGLRFGLVRFASIVDDKRAISKLNGFYKVFKWDDSAGLKAFREPKQRFWEYYHRFPCTNKLPSNATDMYINDIDWNSEIDSKLFLEIKSISDDEEEEEEVKRIDSFSIPLEQIKATRWEYDEPISRLPTIVGS